jgi:membrane associated rhomboid family serine protease
MRESLLYYWNLPAATFAALLADIGWALALVGLGLSVVFFVYLTHTRRQETQARQQALEKLR